MSQRRKIHEEILEKLNGRQKKLPLMLQIKAQSDSDSENPEY